MTSQCDGFDGHKMLDDAQLGSATTSSQTTHCARHLVRVRQMWTKRTETDTRKALAKAIHSCRTQSRDKLFVTTKVLGGVGSAETLASHGENLGKM